MENINNIHHCTVDTILQYLKDQLIDELSRGVTPLKTTDLDWVITVPAIWDARGKRMMREAAYLVSNKIEIVPSLLLL